MSFAPSLTQTSPVRRGRTERIALWAVQFGLAAMFLLAGGSKLLGVPAMVALFDAIGIGQWFRYVTGLIEVGSAIALLVPSFAVFGALALVATMVGAIITHLLEARPRCRRFFCSDRQQLCGLEGIRSSATGRRCADDLNGLGRWRQKIEIINIRSGVDPEGRASHARISPWSDHSSDEPSDLGERLKPFVFLDLFEADMRALAGNMPVHPHSGIATVTVFTRGGVTFADPIAGHGTIGNGGLESARGGLGLWHGKESSRVVLAVVSTVTPHSRSRAAIARPIPFVPPVTSARSP